MRLTHRFAWKCFTGPRLRPSPCYRNITMESLSVAATVFELQLHNFAKSVLLKQPVLQQQNQLCRNKTASHFCSENLHRCKKSRRLRIWTPPAVTTNSLPVLQSSLSSGAEWKSRWSSWAPRSYLIVSMDVKQYWIKQSSVKCRGNIVAGRLIMPPPVFNCDLSLLISSCSAVMIKAC